MILSKYSKTFRNPSGIHLWSTGKNLQVLKVGNARKKLQDEEEYKNSVFLCVEIGEDYLDSVFTTSRRSLSFSINSSGFGGASLPLGIL